MSTRQRPTPQERRQLSRELLDGQADLFTLLDRHGLAPEQVKDWLADTDDVESLRSLVQLADLQAQLMLSRFRLSVVARLVALANDEDPKQREPARRACVDLLKARLDAAPAGPNRNEPVHDESGPDLRTLLYGDLPDGAPAEAERE